MGALLQLLIGGALAVLGAWILGRGASGALQSLRFSKNLRGLTFGTFGASILSLMLSAQAAATGNLQFAIGQVLGVGMLLLLCALPVLLFTRDMPTAPPPLRLDATLLLAAMMGAFLVLRDGVLAHWEGVVLCMALLLYVLAFVRTHRHRPVSEIDTSLRPPLLVSAALMLIGFALITTGNDLLLDAAAAHAAGEAWVGLFAGGFVSMLPMAGAAWLLVLAGRTRLALSHILSQGLVVVLVGLMLLALMNPLATLPPYALTTAISLVAAGLMVWFLVRVRVVLGKAEAIVLLGVLSIWLACLFHL